MVAPIADSGSSLSERNWKRVPTGMATDGPGPTSTVSSSPPSRRHIRPRPEVKHQTSSTVRCATALETARGGAIELRQDRDFGPILVRPRSEAALGGRPEIPDARAA